MIAPRIRDGHYSSARRRDWQSAGFMAHALAVVMKGAPTLSEELDDSMSRNLNLSAPRRNVLKGAGGLALGALGLTAGSGAERSVSAAPRAQDATPAAAGGKRPNVVVIMSDDVGWGDLGCYGGGPMRGAPTPNLDQLAAEGMRFVNYYGQASCTAGRASFITGRIPIRTALSLVLLPGDPDHLTPETPTVAQFMGDQGYTTVQIGKWHLGDVDEAYPIANGFDEMYHMLPYYAGVYAYPDTNLTPDWPADNPEFMDAWNKFNLGEWEGKAGQPAVKTRDFTWQDLATVDTEMQETAIKWLQDHAADENPFFMYLNFMKVHNPNFPSPEWQGKSPGRHPYLDSLMELDDNSGKVVQAIRDLGIAENTLVIWTTDNGAWVDAWPDAGYTPFRGEKGSAFEGGFRCPAIAWWPGAIAPGQVATEMMSHMDWWPTFAGLIGVEPPPHIWVDNNGAPIVFDGIDNSEYLLGKGPSARDTFFYYYDQAFGGVRVENYKFLFTAKDTWLGPSLPLTSAPSMYNLFWDPGEQYDSVFNGAMPTAGEVQTSPGRFSGADHGWTLTMFMTPALDQHFAEIAKYPNKPSLINGGPYYQIPAENRPG
jgi:arylsulfatase A-like enzyme